MTADRARLSEGALVSLDALVTSTLQILTAYQLAGDTSGQSSAEAITTGSSVLKEASGRQADALRCLREQLQHLSEAPANAASASGRLLRSRCMGYRQHSRRQQ